MTLAFPPIYLLQIGFEKTPFDLHSLEVEIGVVWDIKEAQLVLGRLRQKTRAKHELRKLKLVTEDVDPDEAADEDDGQPQRKKRKLNGSEGEDLSVKPTTPKPLVEEGIIKVLNLAWYHDSMKAGKLLTIEEYLVYEGRIIEKAKLPSPRTAVDNDTSLSKHSYKHDYKPSSSRSHQSTRITSHPKPTLLQETTEDHDATFPPIPEYLNSIYCCQRPTPLHCPNEEFVAQLRIMKKGRMLEGEKMSERAYNAAIATVASYPYTITSPFEIKRLPHCGEKICAKWREWKEHGCIREAEDFLNSEKFQAMSAFFDIHEVGQKRALEFWERGWRDLDDVVHQGWNELSRIQQVGLKYLDDFNERIPRPEVEGIANKVLEYAQRIHPEFQMVICGGYRRGKDTSGDVDVILSNPDEEATLHALEPLLQALEEDGYIQFRLEYAETNSNRKQEPVSIKRDKPTGSGFDTLDHAFVVWQEPSWATEDEDLKANPDAKNPNLHRRLDIIITPWKTAGCAVLGWSGGTMFERDLRLYCRDVKKCKFDSSGIRDLYSGEWLDLEKGAENMLDKERKVFEGLDLEWRDPTARCTD